MKKFVVYILLLMPVVGWGQLFPKLPDYKGNIKKITERRYGKEIHALLKDSGIFKAKTFSGWEYTYQFENSKLVKKTNKLNGQINADYLYQHEEHGNRRIEREVIEGNGNGKKGDYIEYENLINSNGLVEKVNYWSYSAKDNTRELYLVEKDAQYDKENKLTAYTRYSVKGNGDLDSGEKCTLFYSPSDRLLRLERKDNATGLKTILYYHYNRRGYVKRFCIDYMVGLRNNQNTNRQDIHYKYDLRGNWIKRYWIADNKKRLEDRRKIKYN